MAKDTRDIAKTVELSKAIEVLDKEIKEIGFTEPTGKHFRTIGMPFSFDSKQKME